MMLLRSEKQSAAAGGRAARVCDSCMSKRARWFCAADDAFLCQSCDVSVHSANQLARRHDRIRLETASFKSQSQLPPWPKGFTRKARTPRPTKQKASVFSLVPEIGNDDDGLLLDFNEEENPQFVHHHHQVPVFDPLIEEENFLLTEELEDFGDGFLPSEVDLAEFVADVENLLETQQEEQERLLRKVKDEEQEENGVKINGFLGWNFKGEEVEEDQENKMVPMVENEEELLKKIKKKKKKTNIFLRLNYDAVIMAWDAQSSPYTTGNRPEFDLDECWV